MRKRYLKLTKDQKERGIVFSSELKVSATGEGSVLHEVEEDDPNRDKRIALL